MGAHPICEMTPSDDGWFSMNSPWAHDRVLLSGPLGEIEKDMVDEDRMIKMGEKMNMHGLNNIRWFNNQKSLVMFTYIDPGHEQTHNTFLATS